MENPIGLGQDLALRWFIGSLEHNYESITHEGWNSVPLLECSLTFIWKHGSHHITLIDWMSQNHPKTRKDEKRETGYQDSANHWLIGKRFEARCVTKGQTQKRRGLHGRKFRFSLPPVCIGMGEMQDRRRRKNWGWANAISGTIDFLFSFVFFRFIWWDVGLVSNSFNLGGGVVW